MIITGLDRLNVYAAFSISEAKLLVELLRSVSGGEETIPYFLEAADKVKAHGFSVTDNDAILTAEHVQSTMGQVVDTYRVLSKEEAAEFERRQALAEMSPASEVTQ
jgi:hypothetical protein